MVCARIWTDCRTPWSVAGAGGSFRHEKDFNCTRVSTCRRFCADGYAHPGRGLVLALELGE